MNFSNPFSTVKKHAPKTSEIEHQDFVPHIYVESLNLPLFFRDPRPVFLYSCKRLCPDPIWSLCDDAAAADVDHVLDGGQGGEDGLEAGQQGGRDDHGTGRDL